MRIPAIKGHYVNVRGGGVVPQKRDAVTVEKLLKTKTNDKKIMIKQKMGFHRPNSVSIVAVF